MIVDPKVWPKHVWEEERRNGYSYLRKWPQIVGSVLTARSFHRHIAEHDNNLQQRYCKLRTMALQSGSGSTDMEMGQITESVPEEPVQRVVVGPWTTTIHEWLPDDESVDECKARIVKDVEDTRRYNRSR